MAGRSVQLPLQLAPRDSLAPAYFVPHSGVREVLETFDKVCSELRRRLHDEDEIGFHFFFVSGPSGSGKSHLARVVLERVHEVSDEIPCEIFELHGIGRVDGETTAAFIDAYQRLRGVGGVLVVFSTQLPDDDAWDPHLGSRFRCALPLVIDFPSDDELEPLVLSVLERANLRLPHSDITYLLQRVPARPLSLTHIFDSVSRLALAEGKPVGRGIFRAVLAAHEDGASESSPTIAASVDQSMER